jgi:glycine oxidase
MSEAAPDVVVLGGGVIGLSIAWRARQRGLTVEVVDDAPGRGASWAAAGLIAPVTEVHHGEEALLDLAADSARRYPDFIEELEEAAGRPAGYRRSGTLMVAPGADDLAALSEIYALQRKLGLEVSRLSGREARALEPGLTPHVRGGFLIEGDHAVDNRLLGEALLEACRRSGVELTAARVAAVEVGSARITGGRLASGEVRRGGTFVLAAGCWSAALPGLPPEAVPPVRPVKGQLLYLRAEEGELPLSRNVRGVDVYIVPRSDGRIAIGATVEERGFDTTVTADGIFQLLCSAFELVPGLRECELIETLAGLRPGTPDNAPLLGRGALENLVVATGHYRNGILLTPVTADEIAALLAGEEPPLLEPFSPLRFAREPA